MSAPAAAIAPPIAAVILAAGKGTRMGSDLHKVLHPLAGRSLLARVLESVDALGAARHVTVVGAGREQIHAAFPDLPTVTQARQLGTADAVASALPALADFEGTVLVLYGDVPLIRAATMRELCALVQGETTLAVLGFRPADPGAYGRLVSDAAGDLVRIVEHAEARAAERAIGLCNSGILAARADVLRALLPQIGNANAKGEFYLTDIVALARAAGHRIATAEADPLEVTGVNSQAELAALEHVLAEEPADG